MPPEPKSDNPNEQQRKRRALNHRRMKALEVYLMTSPKEMFSKIELLDFINSIQ